MAEKKEKQYVSDNAQLMAEWDWAANNALSLDPHRLTHGSTKKVSWICSNGHKFSARIDHRTIMKTGCPYCSGKKPIPNETDLATTHPHLLQEWDYAHNLDAPETYTAGSNKKVHWICSKCGHQWQTKVISRASKNSSCPACMALQRSATRKYNTIQKRGSLAIELPNLAAEWDFSKNGALQPTDVHASSKDIVWWRCSNNHSWKAAVRNRATGSGCPFCAGKIVLNGFNDLETKFPDVAAQWHPTKNGQLTPSQITAHNNQKVWWFCDICGESYFTSVYSRTSLQTGCPICTNRLVIPGVNDLATTHPSIADEWNITKNGDLQPTDLVAGSNQKVWWLCEKGHEWQSAVSARRSGRGCPECAKKIRPITRQKTYLTKNGSLLENQPKIAEQWHPRRNGTLLPKNVTSGSNRSVWWLCEKGHEWEAIISSRTAGRGCPYCNNEHSTSFPEQIILYYLSKATTAVNRYQYNGREIDIYLPELNIGIEYNGRYYHKNRTQQDNEKYHALQDQGVRLIIIYECNITAAKGDILYYQYTNSEYLNFSETVQHLLQLCGLPSIDVDIQRDRTMIFEQFILQEKSQSLAVKFPWLIEEWDYEKNGKLTPWQIPYGSKKRIHWKCTKCGYRWEAIAYSRKKSGCPCCANRVAVEGINDLSSTHPYLAEEWDYLRNAQKPTEVVAGSHQYVWWICQHGHKWKAQIKSRSQGTGCPLCNKEKLSI